MTCRPGHLSQKSFDFELAGPYLTMARRQIGRAALKCLESASASRLQGVPEVSGRSAGALLAAPASFNVLQARGIVMPAQEESYDSDPATDFSKAALNTHVDRVGAVSVLAEEDDEPQEGVFQNRDGRRFEDGRYAAFTKV